MLNKFSIKETCRSNQATNPKVGGHIGLARTTMGFYLFIYLFLFLCIFRLWIFLSMMYCEFWIVLVVRMSYSQNWKFRFFWWMGCFICTSLLKYSTKAKHLFLFCLCTFDYIFGWIYSMLLLKVNVYGRTIHALMPLCMCFWLHLISRFVMLHYLHMVIIHC